MTGTMGKREIETVNRESTSTWEQIASWWDDYVGDDGNRTHRDLVAPAQERLLGLKRDETVLDVACGNGIFSRRMAQLGARVVAVDASETFIERAKGRTTENADRIDYRVVDATDADQLVALGERRFDAAVCAQALMDMATIKPLASALETMLRGGGRFVFTVPHPCFNMNGAKMVVEKEDRDGEMVTARYVKVSQYMTPTSGLGIGMRGQPFPTPYFDRPMGMLFNTFFEAGFVFDGIEEPAAGPDDVGENPFSWSNYKEIPSVLMARMRPARGV